LTEVSENKNILIDRKFFKIIQELFQKEWFLLLLLIIVKTSFQVILLISGYRWLSADDYCRTVISFEWIQNPKIYSGVWLPFHFWLNGFLMIFIKDLFTAATILNFIFSLLSLVYFFRLVKICFNLNTAFISSLIFSLFPFQVWLSISGLPESPFFFFIIAGIYYFIIWKKSGYVRTYLLLSSLSFAFSNGFRYEGWLFSLVFLLFVVYEVYKNKSSSEIKVEIGYNSLLIAFISFTSIIFWLILNFIDYKDPFYFIKETARIYEDYNNTKFMQRLFQYPIFIFYIAPLTTFFATKEIFMIFREKNNRLLKYFLYFNIFQLLFLILQGVLGTGGTNMISRYIVINSILFIPLAVRQLLKFRDWLAYSLLIAILTVNLVWSLYYPVPYREDTFETSSFIRQEIKKDIIQNDEKIYFEIIEGFYDIYPIQTFSNKPDIFLTDDLSKIKKTTESRNKKKDGKEDLNILDIKSYFEKNKVNLALVKSDNYKEKLKLLGINYDEIGDYKIFRLKENKRALSDSAISQFAKNVISLDKNPNLINYNRLFAIKDLRIDNTNFTVNPQTISIILGSVNPEIIDSLDYDNFGFERYSILLELRTIEEDSLVYSEQKKIFSEKNIEDLINFNEVKMIIVLKPFATLYYTSALKKSPFESGVYNISLKLFDKKINDYLPLYRGDKMIVETDTAEMSDSLTILRNNSLLPLLIHKINRADSITMQYDLGKYVALFPDTKFESLIENRGRDVIQLLSKNGIQVFFSQRYQGDQFLNWVFTNF